MPFLNHQRDTAFAGMVGLGLLLCMFGCTVAPPPSPPSQSNEDSDENDTNADNADDSEDDTTSEEDPDTDEDNDPDNVQNSTDDETQEGQNQLKEPTTFLRTPAAVGDKETKTAVKQCIDQGFAFDRFATGTGGCTGVQLAKVDCSVDGISKILSAKQLEQFTAALAGSYSGWQIDQCLDCPKGGTDELCQNTDSGIQQEGTKIFFVKEEAGQIKGKSMLLPIRPWQSSTTATAP